MEDNDNMETENGVDTFHYETNAELEDRIIDYEGDLDLDSEEEDDDETIFSEPICPANDKEKIAWQEQIRMIHLRSHLNELDEKVKLCSYNTEKTREELKTCQTQMNLLEKERDDTFDAIEAAEANDSIATVYRLTSAHERLCNELEEERKLADKISVRLEKTEYDLWKAEVDKGKFLLAEDELKYKEQQLIREKTDHAINRMNKEERAAKQVECQLKRMNKEQTEMVLEQRLRHKQAMEESRKSHKKVNKYLNATLQKLKEEEKEKHSDYKADMQRKIDMLLKLKKDIVTNKENMKAIKARDRAQERERNVRENIERQKIAKQGGNADEAMLIKKRLNEFEKQKLKFEAEKKGKQADIMKKVLDEEKRMEKRKREQSFLWADPKKDKEKILPPHKKKPLKCLEDYSRPALESAGYTGSGDFQKELNNENIKNDGKEEDEVDGGKAMYLSSEPTIINHPDSSDSEEEAVQEDAVNLAKPEFEGLWDTHKPYHVPKDIDTQLKLPGATKMERNIMKKVLEKHRDGITIKQVAAGREFTGCPFYSKPDVIHFKNFDVGQTYKKKVSLTNVSYTVNYCKYVSITERLKDFIKIDFDPPGQMSAGLTCDMLVTFKPMINEDLEGEVNFLSQTGPFSIPLVCSTKKCDVKVDTNLVDFGVTVIGETLKRTVTLTNKGAMATKFDFFKVTGMKHGTCTTAETSLGRLTSDTMRALSPESSDQKIFDSKQKINNLDKIIEQSPEVSSRAADHEGMGTVNGGSKEEEDDVSPRQPDLDEYQHPPLPEPSPEFAFSEMEDYGTVDGMKVGSTVSGEIQPFTSVKLEIIWQPTVPGAVDSEFLISFSDPLSEGISIHAVAKAIDVPVWLERQNVDLKICMFDRLYQDTIVANNRATTALRLKFEVCKDLENHLELLPKTGYIQAQSQFSAQLKFLPRPSLFQDANKYFDKETGVLEAPMTIRVADQTQPVTFTVCAVVTNSEIEFDVSNIDFGYSSIYESVKKTIKVTNKSILPQQFGFIGLPEHVEVQPNDGFGTLLPLETIDLDVIFSPKKAHEYKFDLVCKSLINRDFKIHCKGVGVHPPLELSQQVVHFVATSMYDVSTAALHVVNSHTSSNEFTHPVPRIGKGDIAPVGPTSFEFVLPEDCPLTISPSVGMVTPGKKCRVQIRFSPKLKEEDVRKEAVKMATKQMEAKAQQEYEDALKKEIELQEQAQVAALKKPPKGKASPKGKGKPSGSLVRSASTIQQPKPIVPPEPDTITKDSSAYSEAIGSLLRQFKGKFHTYTVPCYIASGSCSEPGTLPYSIHNTMYVEIHCPTIKPPVVILSDSGRNVIDFGEVSIGQSVLRSVTMQNISDKTVTLSSSLLNTDGPFLMLNALRFLAPGGTHTAVLSFAPTNGRKYQEVLGVISLSALLSMTLVGKGVSPIVNLSLESDVLDMGAVLSEEYCERTFKIHNTSSLSIDYVIKLDSLSLLRHAKAQHLPAFIKRDKKNKSYVGTQNNNGQNVFDLVPFEGTIPADGMKEVTVTFAPDHASEHYSDGVRIELFGQEESHFFELHGVAKDHIMYMFGGDDLTPDIESLAVTPVIENDEDFKIPPTPILVTLYSVAKDNEYTTASKDIYVACVRTMAVSQKKESKKNGEFQFENIQAILGKGFNVEPQRGMIEAGTKKGVTITWTPPAGHESNQTMETSGLVTLKGDVTEQYRILLRGLVVSE